MYCTQSDHDSEARFGICGQKWSRNELGKFWQTFFFGCCAPLFRATQYLGIWFRLYRYRQIAICSGQKITHFLVLGRLAAFRLSTCVLNTYLNLVYFHSTVACIIYPKFTRLGSARYPQIIWGTLKSRALQRALNLRAFTYPQIPSNFEFEVLGVTK